MSWAVGNSRRLWIKTFKRKLYNKKKGSPVHVAPACADPGDGPDHFGSIVRSLSLHFCKRLFPGLEPMTSRSQGSSFTAAPRLPFKRKLYDNINKLFDINIDFGCIKVFIGYICILITIVMFLY
jgi:hypothetical protein